MACAEADAGGRGAEGAGAVAGSSSETDALDSARADAVPPEDFDSFDDWEFDEQLREIGRALRAVAPTVGTPRDDESGDPPVGKTPRRRFDPAHPDARAPHTNLPIETPEPRAVGSGLGGLAWAALSLGTMGLVCGGILLGWSIWTDRADLWAVGLPIALAGQIGLVVGLLCQLDRVWHDHRRAARKLDEVDQKLRDLRVTTAQLSTTHSSPATAFYCHLAGGAPPELLLGDLKSQLDLLAVQLSRRT